MFGLVDRVRVDPLHHARRLRALDRLPGAEGAAAQALESFAMLAMFLVGHELGHLRQGHASLAIALNAGVTLGAGVGGLYEINQNFAECMRVMFLAEEIAPVRAGLAGGPPSLGRLPVRGPLVWNEG